MPNTKRGQRDLICSICRLHLSRGPNKANKPYAVRDENPVICNVCGRNLSGNNHVSANNNLKVKDIDVHFDYSGLLDLLDILEELDDFSPIIKFPVSISEILSTAQEGDYLEFVLADIIQEAYQPVMDSLVKDAIVDESEFGATDTNKKNEKVDEKVKPIKPLIEIINAVKLVIKGQDAQIEDIGLGIYKNVLLKEKNKKSNIIVIGNTGVGKTSIINLMAKEFGLPCVKADFTRFTEAGYVGANAEEIIQQLYTASNNDVYATEHGIIILDEFDKKKSYESTSKDPGGESAQNSFLKILEGTRVEMRAKYGEAPKYIDTSKITFIAIGAFPKIDKIVEKRLKKDSVIGFSLVQEEEKNTLSKETRVIPKDVCDFGFTMEIIGRFSSIVQLNNLTVDNIVDIIAYSPESSFFTNVNLLKDNGIDVEIEEQEKLIRTIAEEVFESGTGARNIDMICERIFKKLLFEALTSGLKYKNCKIYPEIVKDSTKYTLEKEI